MRSTFPLVHFSMISSLQVWTAIFLSFHSMLPKGRCLAFQKHLFGARRNIKQNVQQQRNFRSHNFLPTFAPPSGNKFPHPGRTSTRSWGLHQSFTTSDGESCENSIQEPISLNMENLYREWTLEQDELLWANHDSKSTIELATLLGRGLNGVRARLSKLQDVSSPAYERLFVTGRRKGKNNPNKNGADGDDDDSSSSKQKLAPAGEVLRRIEYDYRLQQESSNFFVLHYDRVDDNVVESPLNAPNNSIQGSATSLVKALPEHRIVGIKYKERIVWDRAQRLDLVFCSDDGGGIYDIIDTYDDWKVEQDRIVEWNIQRQKVIAQRIQQILGEEHFKSLQQQSAELKKSYGDDTISIKSLMEAYVQSALSLFRSRRRESKSETPPTTEGEMGGESLDIPQTDIEALEELSELVAVLPDPELRSLLLTEISLAMDRLERKGGPKQNGGSAIGRREPLVLLEEELSERFVRGSGAGGQKINKTSNRVVLVHEPTQLRVECQDTRSLTQNRKIARKRLLEKLDEHFHGKQSKIGWKNEKAAEKKQKSKSKNRARQRKKQGEKEREKEDEI